MDKITSVLDALQNIFGKGFLLAGFLPVTTFLTVSWILGCWLSPECRDLTEYALHAKILQEFTIGVVLLLLLSMGSFVFWLLNPAFRQILEGRMFPLFIQDWLAEGHRNKLKGLEKNLEVLLNERTLYRKAAKLWPDEFTAASTGSGSAIQDQTLPREYKSLGHALDGLKPVEYQRLDAFRDSLIQELRRTSVGRVEALEEMRDETINRFVPLGMESSERAVSRALADRTFRYPQLKMSVGPTQLANSEEAQRDYLARCYGIDVSVFWSDLQKVAAADEKFAGVLENSKTRFDFSVAMTSVSALFTLTWIIVHVVWGGSLFGSDLWPYTIVSLLGIGITLLFHRLVLISYEGFGDTIRSTVELYRFALVKALHLKLPATDTEEQDLWESLAQRLQAGIPAPIDYDHTPERAPDA